MGGQLRQMKLYNGGSLYLFLPTLQGKTFIKRLNSVRNSYTYICRLPLRLERNVVDGVKSTGFCTPSFCNLCREVSSKWAEIGVAEFLK